VVVLGSWLGVVLDAHDHTGLDGAEDLDYRTLTDIACPHPDPLGDGTKKGPYTEHEWRPATAADVAAVHPSQVEWLRDLHGVDVAALMAGEG
jgi:hypothetical protein